MKLYTSYFYQVRFFQPHQLGFSTCLSDPQWFHQGVDKTKLFVDNNSVVNGLRCPALVPGPLCAKKCIGKYCQEKPPTCAFLTIYYEQLKQINLIKMFDNMAMREEEAKKLNNFKEKPEIIFLFHEPPTKQCSERIVVQRWLRENGIEVEEFVKNNI